jgi:peptidoglycan/xylan/chitin deacetylase (PgdA/CDA1 family)
MLRRPVKLLLSLSIYGLDRARSGWTRQANAPTGGRGVVLYYHAVPQAQRRAFARQMDILLRVARLWRLDTCPPQGQRPLVAVTFDDGYVSVIENALPELRQRGIPATVFVPTGYWGGRPGWIKSPGHPFWQERVMSREELQRLASEPLVTIGSHTVSHPNLLQVSAREASRELAASKAELENLLGRPIEWLSFPHGVHDASLVRLAREAGYRWLFTIEPTLVDPLQLGVVNGRVAADPNDWPLEFFLKIHGAYRWQTRLAECSAKADGAKSVLKVM